MRDELVDAVHAAWAAHTKALDEGDEVAIHRAYIQTLKAERALEQDAFEKCVQQGTRAAYMATIKHYDAIIEDEEARLQNLLEVLG